MSTSLSTLATELKARLPHQDLPKYAGKPQFAQVREIEKLIEENAGSIESSVVGAGEFNHIFLTKTPEDWTDITGLEPVNLPVNPPPPVIGNHATAAQIAQVNQAYNAQKKIYEKTRAMKELLINQIVSSFDAKYVKPLKHPVTRQINHQTIPAVFSMLYRYGRIKSETVREKEADLLATPVDLEAPLLILYDEIEDVKALAQAAGVTRTNNQIMDLTISILRKCGTVFRNAIIEWDERPEAEKTWTNLKTHFEDIQMKLQNASDVPIGETNFQQQEEQANLIAERVAAAFNDDLQHQLNNIQQVLSDVEEKFNNASSSKRDDEQQVEEDRTPSSSVKNSYYEDKINSMQQEHQQQIEDLKAQLAQLQSDNNNSSANYNRNNYNRNNNNRNNKRKFDRSYNNNRSGRMYVDNGLPRESVSKYCWTHGACGHTGKECTRRRDGHKEKATFKNKMGGSERFCQFVKNNE